MTFSDFKTVNRGATGMVLTENERRQRVQAMEAYRQAFGPTLNRQTFDKAIEYANYQIARQRGWAHLHD